MVSTYWRVCNVLDSFGAKSKRHGNCCDQEWTLCGKKLQKSARNVVGAPPGNRGFMKALCLRGTSPYYPLPNLRCFLRAFSAHSDLALFVR